MQTSHLLGDAAHGADGRLKGPEHCLAIAPGPPVLNLGKREPEAQANAYQVEPSSCRFHWASHSTSRLDRHGAIRNGNKVWRF